MDKGTDRVDAWLGPTVRASPAARTAAEALVRRWAVGAGLDEAATLELLETLGLGDGEVAS